MAINHLSLLLAGFEKCATTFADHASASYQKRICSPLPAYKNKTLYFINVHEYSFHGTAAAKYYPDGISYGVDARIYRAQGINVDFKPLITADIQINKSPEDIEELVSDAYHLLGGIPDPHND